MIIEKLLIFMDFYYSIVNLMTKIFWGALQYMGRCGAQMQF